MKLLSARHRLSLFLVAVVFLAFWQVWLTWRLTEQDRGLELQRSHGLMVQTADLAVAQMGRKLGNWELCLRSLQSLPPPPTTLDQIPSQSSFVTVFHSGVLTYPQKPLLFLPEALAPVGVFPEGFERADELEYRDVQYRLALTELQRLAKNSDTRAEALFRIARVQRKCGEPEAALITYGLVAREANDPSASNSSGVPYGLLAANARCRILAGLGRTEAAQNEAKAVRADLSRGRWPLRRESFEYQWNELARVARMDERFPEPAFTFAIFVSRLFETWQSSARSGTDASGREMRRDSSLLMWSATGARLNALLAPPEWLASSLDGAASLPNIRWKLLPPGPVEESNFSVTRSLADLQMVGRMQFSNVQPPSQASSSRHLLWLAGVGLMVLLVLFSGYAVLRAISQELQVANLQSDFVSAVSHEFRSPLTALRTITELLVQNRITDESRRQKSYEFLDHETNRLHQLVESLLDFGRMESGRKQYRVQTHDVFQLVRDTVTEFGQEAAENGFRIDTNLDTAPANVKVDEEALRRAVRNLLENAVKYSPECRTVWVFGAVKERDVSISVRDQGMGIDPEEQRQIFQKFVRGTAAKKAGIKGTGIGLSMVYQIAKAFDGRVQLESKTGGGSTFTIVLPLADS